MSLLLTLSHTCMVHVKFNWSWFIRIIGIIAVTWQDMAPGWWIMQEYVIILCRSALIQDFWQKKLWIKCLIFTHCYIIFWNFLKISFWFTPGTQENYWWDSFKHIVIQTPFSVLKNTRLMKKLKCWLVSNNVGLDLN